jgi:nucleotide-binding universal stress UspA family protein
MSNISNDRLPVLVCTDGSEAGEVALRYACEEAQRRHTALRVLHVPPELVPFVPLTPVLMAPAMHGIGAQILKEAVHRCQELAPELRVDGVLGSGPRVPCILDEARDAACVVLGSRQWSLRRFAGGATTSAVASHAACPVVAVPPLWEPSRMKGRVVVGVNEHSGPREVLEIAFEEARTRGAELVIAHAWRLWPAHEADLASDVAEEWMTAARRSLAEATSGIRADNPDVTPLWDIRHFDPRDTLVELAAEAELLVVGRHGPSFPWIHRLGSIAHAALRSSPCPVQIVPPRELLQGFS